MIFSVFLVAKSIQAYMVFRFQRYVHQISDRLILLLEAYLMVSSMDLMSSLPIIKHIFNQTVGCISADSQLLSSEGSLFLKKMPLRRSFHERKFLCTSRHLKVMPVDNVCHQNNNNNNNNDDDDDIIIIIKKKKRTTWRSSCICIKTRNLN